MDTVVASRSSTNVDGFQSPGINQLAKRPAVDLKLLCGLFFG